MADQIVVGLFPTLGRAEDVRSRLITEGVPAADIEIRELRQWNTHPDLLVRQGEEGLAAWMLGTKLPEKYAVWLRNGESAVLVCAHDEAEIETAAYTMRQFVPLAEIDVFRPGEEGPFLASAQAANPE